MEAKLLKTAECLLALVTLAIIVVVAVGNWNLHRRVRKLEASLGLRAMPRLRAIS
jgi:cytochrome oxidase assembly protein ShyY1